MRDTFDVVLLAAMATSTLAVEKDPLKMNLYVTMDDYSTHWIDNRLDHFDQSDMRTYKQRFWFNDKFYSGKETQGPVFLYICGEWTCSPPDD